MVTDIMPSMINVIMYLPESTVSYTEIEIYFSAANDENFLKDMSISVYEDVIHL